MSGGVILCFEARRFSTVAGALCSYIVVDVPQQVAVACSTRPVTVMGCQQVILKKCLYSISYEYFDHGI
jgi:hypothetical protein